MNKEELDNRIEAYRAADRKATPVFSGVLNYFPDALQDVAKCSQAGNDQHHPDTPLHWDRAKSTDELDALTRHLLDAGTLDTDGIRHSTKVAWRALANLQKEIELDRAAAKDTKKIQDEIIERADKDDKVLGNVREDFFNMFDPTPSGEVHKDWKSVYISQVGGKL